MASQLASAN